MPYVPINTDAYTAAYAGAVAGMAVGSWITSASIANYDLVTKIAGAFAEEFDIVWNNAVTLNGLEFKAITSVCQNEFMNRQPGALANPDFQVPATWFIPASACAALVLQSDAYFASEGIIPPDMCCQAFKTITDTFGTVRNNYEPTDFHTADIVRVNPTADVSMTGVDAPAAGEKFRVVLQSISAANELTLTNLDGGSLAANQLSLPQSLPIVLGPGESIELQYDTILTKWVPFANTGQVHDMVSAWYRAELNNGDKAANFNLIFKDAQKQRVRLTGSPITGTMTFPGVGNYLLKVVQDGTGGRLLTLAVTGGVVKKPGGTLVFTSTANATDLVSLYYDGTDAYASIVPNYS